jgi:(p)ppGpp synthase/HD superfamily hydrolase
MNAQNQLAMAISVASSKFFNIFDKGGAPYILHCLKVMHYLKTDDLELMAAAVLHDIIEDTDVTYEDLRNYGFSERVIAAVRAMTKMRGQSYEEYKLQVKANPDAVRIKMADLRHNSDIRRLKGVTEKDIRRIEKYMKFYNELKEMA